MRPVSNQSLRFFATVKTHKFDDHSLINVDDLKFRPIIHQSNTYTYNAPKIVSDYLQSLAHNDYVVKDTIALPEIIKNDVLDPNEGYIHMMLKASLRASLENKQFIISSQRYMTIK